MKRFFAFFSLIAIFVTVFLPFSALAATPTITVNSISFSNGANKKGTFSFQFTVSPVTENEFKAGSFTYNVAMDGKTYVNKAEIRAVAFSNAKVWKDNVATINSTIPYTPGPAPTSFVLFRLLDRSGTSLGSTQVQKPTSPPDPSNTTNPTPIPSDSSSRILDPTFNVTVESVIPEQKLVRVRWKYTIDPYESSTGYLLRVVGKDGKVIAYYTPNKATVSVIGAGTADVGSKSEGTEETVVPQSSYTDPMAFQLVDKDKKNIIANTTPAAPTSTGDCYKFSNTLFGNGVCAPDYLNSFYRWAVGIAVAGSGVMIIYAGYKYTISRGDQGQMKDAKEIIISVLVGLTLLLLSYTILRFLGINLTPT